MHSRLPPLEAQPGEEEVERVICASEVSDRNGVYATMEDIREHALRHNPAVGIHVALLYQSGWFLHWAEGPKQAVRTLFDRIRQDPRHHDQTVVHHSRGRRLLMTTWSMLLSPSTETPEQFGRRVLALREQMKRGRQYAPTSVVRQLMMPMRLPQAQSLPDPEAYHRVVVCAAYGNGAFGLVHWLAQQHSLPKESRRLAGESDLDSGSDYVEFMMGEHPCRVIAVARSNLASGLHRSLVPDWRFLVLLFSADMKRNEALLDRVRLAFQDIHRAPELIGMAPDAATRARVEQSTRPQGLRFLDGGLVHDSDSEAIWKSIAARLEQVGEPRRTAWDTVSSFIPL